MVSNQLLALASSAANINSIVLWAIFAFFLLIFLVVSSVLSYHWKTYGMGSRKIILVRNVYFGVSALIIFVATMSIISF